MRVTDVYLSGFGPFPVGEALHLNTNDDRVLFLGLSGSGKTTVLRAITAMWLELGHFLHKEPGIPQVAGDMAMVIDTDTRPVVIALGSRAHFEQVLNLHKDAWWMHGQDGRLTALNETPPDFSNMCILDGDIEPSEGSYAPWLITDDDVRKFAKNPFKLTDDMANKLIDAVNGLWIGKNLVKKPDGGLQIKLSTGFTHHIHDLSMGEKRMLALCYLACVPLKPGGILIMDEPDVHLHPAQMMGLIATLENAVLEKHGQVLMASHHPDIWNRYDMLGKVIVMEGRA